MTAPIGAAGRSSRDEPTIQGELQAALGRVTSERPLPQGSGRTDAGVHALGQVASFGLEAPIPADSLRRALNRTLPAAIRVLRAEEAPEGFHARHSAVAKTYEYRVFVEKATGGETLCPPFLARYVYAYPWPMDLERLNEAAGHFVGTQDFLSFAATDPDATGGRGGPAPGTTLVRRRRFAPCSRRDGRNSTSGREPCWFIACAAMVSCTTW